ncbi:P-loop containing nucleoside triphosphate hydrolase protein [Cristinia sonorae]|uniref:P-loop containing nucleoside triphosphate hydrolase protein n=1 Tax=Cristinia sonorae TaxID=1940300 RepID=A0A8K0UYV1_9AGAR|nr:P-loop containing nucleoside triphosphate hydrolase protein [Cristinia sonorae]
MESPSISSLASISPSQQATLQRAKINTVSDLILIPPTEVAKRCKLTLFAAQAIVDLVYRELAPVPIRLDSKSTKEREIFTTGVEDLDTLLGGGIRTGMVWEIVGESAAGKTQLALQTTLFVQLPKGLKGISGSACFLSTSWKLPTTRLMEMIASHPSLSPALCGLQDIDTIKTPTVSILQRVLSHTLPALVETRLQPGTTRKPVKLVVIDALTELFRTESRTSSTSLVERSKDITTISSILHTLAAKYQIAFVVLNEVSDVFNNGDDADTGLQQGEVLYRDQSRWFSQGHSIPGENRKEASLGLTWANQVNARVMLSRTDRMIYLEVDDTRASKRRKLDTPTGQDHKAVRLRRLNVIFSSVGPRGSLDYIVSDRGIVVIPEEHNNTVFSDPSPPKPHKPPDSMAQPVALMGVTGTSSTRSQTVVPSTNPGEQLLDLAVIAVGSDDLDNNIKSDDMDLEQGPQADEDDDLEAYWKDATLDDFYGSIDLDALSSSNPG